MNKMSKIIILVFALFFMGVNSSNAQLNILSGLAGGTYEALSNDIKGASNQEVTVLSSEGSVDNYNQLINLNNNIFVTFLQYDVLVKNHIAGQHIGILLVEAGVGMTVLAAMLLFYYILAMRPVSINIKKE